MIIENDFYKIEFIELEEKLNDLKYVLTKLQSIQIKCSLDRINKNLPYSSSQLTKRLIILPFGFYNIICHYINDEITLILHFNYRNNYDYFHDYSILSQNKKILFYYDYYIKDMIIQYSINNN